MNLDQAQDEYRNQRGKPDFVAALWWDALLLPGSLLLVSWGLLVFAFLTGYRVLIDHDYLLRASHLPWIAALGIFLADWQVMVLAMMMPCVFSQCVLLYRRHQERRRTQALFLLSYAVVWTIFALLAFLFDTLVHQMVRSWWWLYLHAQLIGALTLVVAGIVQWSPMKQRCLQRWQVQASHCVHSRPFDSLPRSWHWGWNYGRWCVESNWALMLLMVAIGMRNLLVIALLALLMFVEREVPLGKWFRLVSGGVFLVLALLWYVFPLLS
ncbi:MAG: DUF2182 domain-containing protein [Chloroflexi bacterium]|nr:DUF2182 domain-containing protein [Chloroflexota bacterium]